jgi:hypothetical protein
VTEFSEQEIERRQNAAGRFGFILGCIATVFAFAISLFRAPKPLTPMTILLAGLMAAINVPVGITLGLLGERLTRMKRE